MKVALRFWALDLSEISARSQKQEEHGLSPAFVHL